VSSLSSIEGTIFAKPFAGAIASGLKEAPVSAVARASGSIAGEVGESAQSSAVAELGNLVSSIGSLSAQAQGLPLTPPTLPGLPQNPSYQPQATDYTQFSDDSN